MKKYAPHIPYNAWFLEVDALCEKQWGLDSISLTGDWESYSAYNDQLTPEEALEIVWETIIDQWGFEPNGLVPPKGY